MMNEPLFFIHIAVVISFLLLALRLGKSALIAFISIGGVLANLFVTKQMEFFSLTITCSDVFMIGAILALNLTQEFYGKESAKKASVIAFVSMIFFAIMSQIHLGYMPSSHDQMHGAFSSILESTPRIVAASIVVFFLVQRIDIFLFAVLKKAFNAKYLPGRLMISLVLTQFLDTILFSYLGLYGIVHSVSSIIVLSFTIKLIVIFCSAPFTLFAKRFYRESAA